MINVCSSTQKEFCLTCKYQCFKTCEICNSPTDDIKPIYDTWLYQTVNACPDCYNRLDFIQSANKSDNINILQYLSQLRSTIREQIERETDEFYLSNLIGRLSELDRVLYILDDEPVSSVED